MGNGTLDLADNEAGEYKSHHSGVLVTLITKLYVKGIFIGCQINEL